jgi:hypothetical protein
MPIKKKTKIALMTLILGATFATGVSAANTWGTYKGFPIVRLFVDGNQVKGKVPAVVINGTTMVPLKVISDSIGMAVNWDQANQTVYVGNLPPGKVITPPTTTPTSPPNDNITSGFDIRGLTDSVDSSGFIHITGEIVNNTDHDIENAYGMDVRIEIKVTFYDSNNRVVGMGTQTLYDKIPRGFSIPFVVVCTGVQDSAVTYNVSVSTS